MMRQQVRLSRRRRRRCYWSTADKAVSGAAGRQVRQSLACQLPSVSRLWFINAFCVSVYVSRCASQHLSVWSAPLVLAVDQWWANFDWLGFKWPFEHFWRFDLNYKDSIQNIAILFESFAIRFDSKKNLNCDKSAACLPTQNGMHELLSKHFCFGCNLMQKLHRTNWLIDIVSSVTLWIALVVALWTETSETDYLLMSRVTRPKITSSDIAILTFYWKFICMFIFVKDLRFHLRSDLERFGIWRKMGIW